MRSCSSHLQSPDAGSPDYSCGSSPAVSPPPPSTIMSTAVYTPRLTSPKRPKLSLQTSTLPLPPTPPSTNPLSLTLSTHSPTVRNTYSNAFQAPTVTPSRAPRDFPRLSKLELPSSSHRSSTSESSAERSTAFPYHLPIGARSILRNSPLPPRIVSASSARTPKRMFPPVKRVVFSEPLVQWIPTPILDESDSSSDTNSNHRSHHPKRTRMASRDEEEGRAPTDSDEPDEPEDMPSTPVQGGRKRRREWVWTLAPLADGPSSPGAGPLLKEGMPAGHADGQDLPVRISETALR